MLTFENLLKPTLHKVEVGKDFVYMRSLTSNELRDLQQKHGDNSLSEIDSMLAILACCLVNADGGPLASLEDLRNIGFDTIKELVPHALRISGLDNEKKS